MHVSAIIGLVVLLLLILALRSSVVDGVLGRSRSRTSSPEAADGYRRDRQPWTCSYSIKATLSGARSRQSVLGKVCAKHVA